MHTIFQVPVSKLLKIVYRKEQSLRDIGVMRPNKLGIFCCGGKENYATKEMATDKNVNINPNVH